jgi:hypothetical protein
VYFATSWGLATLELSWDLAFSWGILLQESVSMSSCCRFVVAVVVDKKCQVVVKT